MGGLGGLPTFRHQSVLAHFSLLDQPSHCSSGLTRVVKPWASPPSLFMCDESMGQPPADAGSRDCTESLAARTILFRSG